MESNWHDMWLGLRKPGISAQNTPIQTMALNFVVVYGKDVL